MASLSAEQDEAGTEALECLNVRQGGCQGPVELRESLSGTGLAIARCDGHWSARLSEHQEHRRIYPDSPIAPAWFDPAAAGERWDEDD